MRRIFLFSLVVAAALAMGMGVGPVGAQDSANETAENATADLEHVAEFADGELVITDYELEDGTATITFDAERSRTVTVSDALAGVGQDGAVQVPEQDYEIERGVTTISMDVRELQGASTVGISVDGTTVRLSTELDQNEADPFATFGGESGLFTGVIMTVVLAAAGAWWVIRSENSGVIEA
ncbi:hypothetical protein [Natrinema versiforme]|uniref:Uncharacterized protein n=1 Tax=Natrinema versiforme JCM 10478 TaxID=1227496 RepID=L9XT29_9EURY|nr:hypothetical protein [Natrinema versiforme]ELY64707.1 hypothetical protein C489_16610 [Natrinema versiforme JCM 10478]